MVAQDKHTNPFLRLHPSQAKRWWYAYQRRVQRASLATGKSGWQRHVGASQMQRRLARHAMRQRRQRGHQATL